MRAFHLIRDPRDVCVSAYYSHLYSHATDVWPELAPHRKQLQALTKERGLFLELQCRSEHFRMMQDWNYDLPNVFEIKMEDLIQNPYMHILKVFCFLKEIVDEESFSAKKRFVYKTKHKIDYKILDLHLLKSKLLINNFDMLNGNEKYHLIRNIIAISLYLQEKNVNKEKVDSEIKKQFDFDIEEIKQNVLEKNNFLKKYKAIYNKTFNKIMKGIKNDTK